MSRVLLGRQYNIITTSAGLKGDTHFCGSVFMAGSETCKSVPITDASSTLSFNRKVQSL